MISGILWTGSSHKILKIAENRQIKIFASQEMIIEFLEVIKREKFSKRISELKTSVTEIVTGILRLVEIVKLEKYKLKSHEIPVDKDDEMFLACALTAEASFI
ncbi:MAG: putative toxin-antitoxin system toxin component, PIN family, partial [bacterium]